MTLIPYNAQRSKDQGERKIENRTREEIEMEMTREQLDKVYKAVENFNARVLEGEGVEGFLRVLAMFKDVQRRYNMEDGPFAIAVVTRMLKEDGMFLRGSHSQGYVYLEDEDDINCSDVMFYGPNLVEVKARRVILPSDRHVYIAEVNFVTPKGERA